MQQSFLSRTHVLRTCHRLACRLARDLFQEFVPSDLSLGDLPPPTEARWELFRPHAIGYVRRRSMQQQSQLLDGLAQLWRRSLPVDLDSCASTAAASTVHGVAGRGWPFGISRKTFCSSISYTPIACSVWLGLRIKVAAVSGWSMPIQVGQQFGD